MGATSITGVGLGSADQNQKGSEHLSVGSNKIIGPRVVYANTVTLDGSGNATMQLPALKGAAANYIVVCTDNNTSAAAAVGAALSFQTNPNYTQVTVKGTASHTIQVAILKVGLAP